MLPAEPSRQELHGRLVAEGRMLPFAGRRDNVFVERLWKSVKYEEVYLHGYRIVDIALGPASSKNWSDAFTAPHVLTCALIFASVQTVVFGSRIQTRSWFPR